MKKYIEIYHIRNIKLALFCAIIGFIPLFIASLFSDVVPEDILISFAPFVLAALGVAVASLYTARFKKLIEDQEQLYNIRFQDTNAQHMETTLYLSEDWLIWAGISAFYKRHIKSISSTRRFGRVGSSYEVTVKTIDDKKYTIWCLSTSNIKKIKEWTKT